MNISIKTNEKPHLKICQMICDTPLHERLENYELLKFFNCHQSCVILGNPGTGKTSFLYSLFKSRKCMLELYHDIYLFQPIHSRNSMKDPLFDRLNDDKKFDKLTLEDLTSVYEKIKGEVLNDEYLEPINSCIIFDDQTAYLKDKEIQSLLKEIFFNRRHCHITLFFSSKLESNTSRN
jgi:AAA15 family ATPase/GTPase